MMKHVPVCTLFLSVVFCTFCKGQNKIDHLKEAGKTEIKEVVTSYGPTTSVRIIRQDRRGDIWLASNEGVIRYDGKSFTNLTGDLSPNRFFSMLEDRNGNFWFANNGLGVYYYDPRQAVGKSLRNFTTTQGLVDNRVRCIYEDRSGIIWIGTRGGVSSYDPGRAIGKSFQNYRMNDGPYNNEANDVTAILEDKTGRFWFGTGGNTYVYDGKTVTVFTKKAFSDVWSIIEDKKGTIWLGGSDGLWRYDGSTFTNFTENPVRYIYEDKKGNIWSSGTNANGIWILSRYDENASSPKKPTVIEITQSQNLFGILEANDGSIWFGSFDGVYRYDGNTVTDFKK